MHHEKEDYIYSVELTVQSEEAAETSNVNEVCNNISFIFSF